MSSICSHKDGNVAYCYGYDSLSLPLEKNMGSRSSSKRVFSNLRVIKYVIPSLFMD